MHSTLRLPSLDEDISPFVLTLTLDVAGAHPMITLGSVGMVSFPFGLIMTLVPKVQLKQLHSPIPQGTSEAFPLGRTYLRLDPHMGNSRRRHLAIDSPATRVHGAPPNVKSRRNDRRSVGQHPPAHGTSLAYRCGFQKRAAPFDGIA